jgi:hypothetical protein
MASISGGQFHFSSGHEPVVGGSADSGSLSLSSIADASGSGVDSVVGAGSSGGATNVGGGSDAVVTSHSQDGGTVVNLPDGSSLTIVGALHVDTSFIN